MELELGEVSAPKSGLRTPQELSRYFRDRVVSEALFNMNDSDRIRSAHVWMGRGKLFPSWR